MSTPKAPKLTTEDIVARSEKPKSMRYVRSLMKPIFAEAQAKFGDAIADIVEREHWGPNFDAYYDIWVRRRSPAIKEFFSDRLFKLQLDKFVLVLAQVKEGNENENNNNSSAIARTKERKQGARMRSIR